MNTTSPAPSVLPAVDRPLLRFGLLWLGVFAVVLVCDSPGSALALRLAKSFVTTSFYIGIIYINYEILLPRLVASKKLLIYLLSLLLAALLLTPLKSLLIYLSYKLLDPEKNIVVDDLVLNFAALVIIGLLSSVVKIISDWLSQQRTVSDLRTQTVSSELKFLKSQINPHFLFNTLNNLYALTLKKSNDAPEVVIKLSDMMRYMLYECNEPKVPLQKEIDYIHNYISLESLRQSKEVDIDFKMDGDPGQLEVAPLLFVPFLENAFKHGLKDDITKGYLHIHLAISNPHLEFIIQNSKPSHLRTQTTVTRPGGIGLENVKRRLKLIYPEKYKLEIEDSPTTYTTSLHLVLT